MKELLRAYLDLPAEMFYRGDEVQPAQIPTVIESWTVLNPQGEALAVFYDERLYRFWQFAEELGRELRIAR